MPDDYKIPSQWLEKMDDKFLDVFINKLSEMFGISDLNALGVRMLVGTTGWRDVMKDTCKACGIESLYLYYRDLRWWCIDRFDDQLLAMLKERAMGSR